MTVLDLLGRLLSKMPYERKIKYAFWATLAVTFVASLVTVFASCQPFQRYWQLNPNPGECVVGDMWLYTYEISNIITDVMLMLVPFILILAARIPVAQRWRILPLFGVGTFLVAISILRISQGIGSFFQRAHTLWASLEVLFAVIVAVTPTIYALGRNRHEETSYGTANATLKTAERNTYHHGSDADRDMYEARVWVELEDGASRMDNTSVDGILVETRRETTDAKI